MVAMQLALAQHATVHFAAGTHAPVQQQDEEHHPAKDKFCQLCLLSKDFSHLLPQAGPDIPVPVFIDFAIIPSSSSAFYGLSLSPYAARAPPSFSA